MILHEDLEAPASLLRFFKEGQKWGDPYTAVLVIEWESPSVVHAVGFKGEVSRTLFRELALWLRDAGVVLLKASRAHGHVVPMAKLVDGVYHFDVKAYCERAGL